MESPLVSVIIPNYNYAGYVVEAVDSVLVQSYPNFETIVVDDGSTDGSKEVLQNYGERIQCIFQKNAGVSAARNNGVKSSKGKYLAFLDADDIWETRKLERQVALFEENPKFGLVHVGVKEIDSAGTVINELLAGSSGSVSKSLLLFESDVILGGGSGIMIPRAVFDELEGFDPQLMNSADWDLYYRISRLYEVGFVPEPLLRYRFHGSNMHGNVKRMEREMLHGYKKAFEENDSDIQEIRREAYANLHRVLSGSYFRAGQFVEFLRHAFKSFLFKPSGFVYFAMYPVRRLKRN